MRSAARRYTYEFGGAMVAYAAVLLGVSNIIGNHPDASWRYVLAIVPVVPMIFALVAFLRFFGQMDELWRRMQFEAAAFSCLVTAFLTLTYGFLEGVGFPHMGQIYTMPLLVMLWGVGLFLAQRRYR